FISAKVISCGIPCVCYYILKLQFQTIISQMYIFRQFKFILCVATQMMRNVCEIHSFRLQLLIKLKNLRQNKVGGMRMLFSDTVQDQIIEITQLFLLRVRNSTRVCYVGEFIDFESINRD